jgi:hypothetical protein
MRKDRYSALLMANMVGRTLQRAPRVDERQALGGFARDMAADAARHTGQMYAGPAWYNLTAGACRAVTRRRD